MFIYNYLRRDIKFQAFWQDWFWTHSVSRPFPCLDARIRPDWQSGSNLVAENGSGWKTRGQLAQKISSWRLYATARNEGSQWISVIRWVIITNIDFLYFLIWHKMSIISFAKKDLNVNTNQSNIKKNTMHIHIFLRIQCMYITCENPCYKVSSKDVPFRPRWAAHASPTLRTRTDYQSVGLQLRTYLTWRCVLSSFASSPKSSNTFEQVNITQLFNVFNAFGRKSRKYKKPWLAKFLVTSSGELLKGLRNTAVNS